MNQKVAVSVNEAAEVVSLPLSMMLDLIAQGRGPALRKVGKRSIVLVEDLRDWAAKLPTGELCKKGCEAEA